MVIKIKSLTLLSLLISFTGCLDLTGGSKDGLPVELSQLSYLTSSTSVNENQGIIAIGHKLMAILAISSIVHSIKMNYVKEILFQMTVFPQAIVSIKW